MPVRLKRHGYFDKLKRVIARFPPDLVGATLGAAVAVALWYPALSSPLWQEDYVWLAQARQGIRWPGVGNTLFGGGGLFWRPLSVGIYWRLAVALTHGHPAALHAFGLGIHFLAFTAVGLFGARLAHVLMGADFSRMRAAAAGAFFYGAHTVHFLPTHWASCRQQTLLVFFEAVALTAWLALIRTSGPRPQQKFRIWETLGVCICAAVGAFGSTEAALTLPLLGAIVWSAIPPSQRPQRLTSSLPATAAVVGVVSVALAWAVIRSQLVVPAAPESPYALKVGWNMVRNFVGLLAFAVGLPREGVRLLQTPGSAAEGVAAIAGCILMQAGTIGALAGVARRYRLKLVDPQRALLAWACFTLVALAPYVPLARQCYAYYVLPALLPYAVLAALAGGGAPLRVLAVPATLAIAAAAVMTWVEHTAPYPATLATARQAAETRASLREQFRRLPPTDRVVIECGDDRLWLFMGWEPGIADALGIEPRRIVRVKETTAPQSHSPRARLLHAAPPPTVLRTGQ
ncbi:MAG: hypothetical protein N2644_05920 [Candidatus Sumerlaea chitinivorans]|nr:hypothetical protein [Candidatus Sumerlaea chitinivorans]